MRKDSQNRKRNGDRHTREDVKVGMKTIPEDNCKNNDGNKTSDVKFEMGDEDDTKAAKESNDETYI